MIAVIDYGVGNLFSLTASLKYLGADVKVTGEKEEIEAADRIILPGVGAFADAKEKLDQTGLVETILEQTTDGKPLLGICLGMQLLFDESHEYGVHKGLGLIKGKIASIDEDLKKAQSNFIKYASYDLLQTTKYGEIYKKSNCKENSNIYVNGMKIAQEDNFEFHYNITNINASIKKALNRERTNVGRSAYTDRVKQILLNSSNKEVLNIMMDQLEKVSYGNNCDEINWTDVAIHMAKQVNSQDDVVFLPQGNYVSEDIRNTIESEGKKIIYIPESIASKFEGMRDDNGNEMGTLDSFMKSYEENFKFDFVNYKDLSKEEKKVYDLCEKIAKELNFTTLLKKLKISNTMHKSMEEEILGVCDHNSDMIVIKRSQLQSPERFLGTLVHEVIHYKTYENDCTRGFENELTNTIGLLAYKLVKFNTESNNLGIFGFVKGKNKK